ncbi:B12-binding domain-containing radical SAM protein [Candidatus Woesearchaeota archaeon]|nr:MAG: radical SAM protein [archaeon GW2011_AR18]MBS3162086.1 B12-binding domain-containing radical SAM protein [Candidatus Woesearchaeota archaeon]HIH26011.1 B12-binding domain-containing radical SAM protein [Nanoarchaeota archaeon]
MKEDGIIEQSKVESEILLIVPPDRSYDRRLPLGIMQISSYLTSKGFNNHICDYKGITQDEGMNKIKKFILDNKPKFVGMSCFITELPIMKELCEFIKKHNKDAVVIIGGPYPTERPDHFIEKKVMFDYLVLGEAEESFYELIKEIKEGRDGKNLNGISYIKGGKLIKNPERKEIQNLDDIPLPAYEKVDMKYYTEPNSWTIRGVYLSSLLVFTARGCPYVCKFCTVRDRRPRMMSPAKIVDHLEILSKQYKIDAIQFGDDTFTLYKWRVYEIFKLLKERNIKLIFGIQTRADLLDEELVKFLKENGVIQVNMGIESGSDKMLKVVDKRVTVERIRQTAEICRRLGMRMSAFMMINIPGETKEDIEASMKLVKEAKFNVTQWSIYNPYPGTDLGGELDLEDLNVISKYPSKESMELIEKKYKYAAYPESLENMLAYIHSQTFNVRNVKMIMGGDYIPSFFRFISFMFDSNYYKQLGSSKRKLDYITSMKSQFLGL